MWNNHWNGEKLQMFQITIHITMDRISIAKELVFFKVCSKRFKNTATAYRDILTILKIIFRNRPKCVILCKEIIVWAPFSRNWWMLLIAVIICMVYVYLIYLTVISQTTHTVYRPVIRSISMSKACRSVIRLILYEPKWTESNTFCEFSIKTTNQTIKNKCANRQEGRTKSSLSRQWFEYLKMPTCFVKKE